MLRCFLAEIPEGPVRVPHLHRCAWKVSLWQGRQHQGLGQPWVFSGWEALNSQRFPDTIPLIGWNRIPVIFGPCWCHLSPQHILSPQTESQGGLYSPRAVSHMDHSGSLPAWGSWNGTRLPAAPGRDRLLLPAASPSCSSWEQLAPSITPLKLEHRCHGVTCRVLSVCPPQLRGGEAKSPLSCVTKPTERWLSLGGGTKTLPILSVGTRSSWEQE